MNNKTIFASPDALSKAEYFSFPLYSFSPQIDLPTLVYIFIHPTLLYSEKTKKNKRRGEDLWYA